MIRGLTFCVVLLACAGCRGQGSADAPTPASKAIVSIGEIRAVTVRAGESTAITIPVVVADGYHVQANPASNEFLVPLEVALEPVDDIEFANPEYPAPRPYRLAGADEDLLTYEGTVSVTLPVTVAGSASAGEKTIKGTLKYQACDSRRCLFPSSVPVAFRIVVAI